MSCDFEAEARAAKVEALESEIERQCWRAKLDLMRNAQEILAMLHSWGPREWNALALSAGKNPPSATTVALVIAKFERRWERVAS
jgi:hypothetical protein